MNDANVDAFPIFGLEYVFWPPGLPLIAKTADTPATTSILVRGGAGTGKTTLAVALAYAISHGHGGVALYLSTEFAATELVYKADTLGLDEGSVRTWASALEPPEKETHEPGTIFAQHLLMTQAGADFERTATVGGRKHAAIDAAWELLTRSTDELSAELPQSPPVRALVVDGFGLPETDDEDKQLRTKVLELIQALESKGITTILVEEAGAQAEGWLPFVADVVFELDLASDPDTGDLLRQLRCPKSRYAVALPGPHDYGIDVDGDFGVWPDLTLAADMSVSLNAEEHDGSLAPAVFIPRKDNGTYALLPAGSVMVSHVSAPGTFTVQQAIFRTPGAQVAHVWCGPLTTVDFPGERVTLSQSQGVFALGWLLIQAHRVGLINTVVFNSVEFWLEHPRSRIRLLRAISMLSSAGVTVCIVGQKGRLAMLDPIADYVQDGRFRSWVEVRPPTQFDYPADRWLMVYSGLANSDCAPPQQSDFTLMGQAEFTLLSGDGLGAATRGTKLTEDPRFFEFWRQIAAIYAGNRMAIEGLRQLASASHPRETIMLLRALARHGPQDRLGQLLGDCKQWFNLPEWYHARLRCELAVDQPALASLGEIIAELGKLADSDQIPARHRAEILYNLSTLATRERDQARATALVSRARELDPDAADATVPRSQNSPTLGDA